ncbi:DUF2029 domain-containing protein [bacterium]|nr:DUF2029 domain-containing protein [bacterium]
MHALLLLSVLTIYFLNNLVTKLDYSRDEWRFTAPFTPLTPMGVDFHLTLHRAEDLLLKTHPLEPAMYPPFAHMFFLPFALIPYRAAYIGHIVLLFACNIAAAVMAVRLAGHVYAPGGGRGGAVGPAVIAATAVLAITSCGFMLSIERGNYDIYPAVLMLMALWVLIEQPRRVWVQVALISMAAHLKIYPVLLLSAVVWRHRWRSVLPIVAVNAALFLVWGPHEAAGCVRAAFEGMQGTCVWMGNHSAMSFFERVVDRVGPAPRVIEWACICIPLLLWVSGAALLVRRGYSGRGVIELFLLSVPVMSVLPSTSHDYKLVIVYPVIGMLLFIFLSAYARTGGRGALVRAVLTLVLAGFIGKPAFPAPLFWVNNKYPFVVILQMLVFAQIVWPEPGSAPESAAGGEGALASVSREAP